MGEQWNVFRKHRNTIFINAHLGWYGNDLGGLAKLMDELPNMYTEVGAVLAELGRQPYTARRFLLEHQDRVFFGTDRYPGRPEQPRYRIYFRFLETDCEARSGFVRDLESIPSLNHTEQPPAEGSPRNQPFVLIRVGGCC